VCVLVGPHSATMHTARLRWWMMWPAPVSCSDTVWPDLVEFELEHGAVTPVWLMTWWAPLTHS
jgi:hypothetical protein